MRGSVKEDDVDERAERVKERLIERSRVVELENECDV